MTKLFLTILLALACQALSYAQNERLPLQIGDSDQISEISWSPNNDLLLTSAGDENSLRLWDVATGRVLWKSNISFLQDDLELYWIRHSAWTKDQKFIVTGNDNGQIQLWEASTGKLRWNIRAHADAVSSLAISPDAKFLVSSSDAEDLKAELKVWDFATGSLINDRSANQKTISAIGFIDNNRFRVGDSLCQITLWAVGNLKPLSQRQVKPCGIVPRKYGWFVYSPNFTFLAAQSQDHLVITNINTASVTKKIPRSNNSRPVIFSANGKLLVIPDSEVLDLETNKVSLSAEFHSGVPSNDSRLIAAFPSYHANGVQIFNSKTLKREKWFIGHPGVIKSLAFSKDGKRFASGSADRIVRIWNADSKELLFSLEGHTRPVESVEFSADGKTLTSRSDEDALTWNTESGAQITAVRKGQHFGNDRNRSLSANGRLALVEENEKPFRLVDTSTEKTIKEFVFIDQLDSLQFCPDEKYFLAKPWWGGWQLWSVAGAKPIREFEVGYSWYNRVAFHPDGKTFITGGEGQNIFMFDLESGKTIWSLFPIDQEEFEAAKAGEARRVAYLNRKKEKERLADIENEPYQNKVYITFDHYGNMTPLSEERLLETDAPKKSKERSLAEQANAVWLRLHNDAPIPIEVPTQSMYLPNQKCFFQFSNGKKLFGLCDNREISVWLGLEDKNGERLPYGFDFGSSVILLPKQSVLFAVPRYALTNGNAIRFSFTFQKVSDDDESEDYGTDRVLRFRESDLPKE